MTKTITDMTWGLDTTGRNTFGGGDIGGRVREGLQGTGIAIVRPVATGISPPTKHSQHPLAIYSSTGLLDCQTHAGGG